MLPSIFGETLFDDFFSDPFEMMPTLRGGHDPLYGKQPKGIMKTDIQEVDNHYEVAIDLPGFKKEDINVELKDGYLSVRASGSLDNEEKDKTGRYIRRERYTGACSRSFYVGDLRSEDISARFEDGILKLTLPKKEKEELPHSNTIAIE